MVYKARAQKGVLGFILAITVASITMINFSDGLLYFQILLSVTIKFSAVFVATTVSFLDNYLFPKS